MSRGSFRSTEYNPPRATYCPLSAKLKYHRHTLVIYRYGILSIDIATIAPDLWTNLTVKITSLYKQTSKVIHFNYRQRPQDFYLYMPATCRCTLGCHVTNNRNLIWQLVIDKIMLLSKKFRNCPSSFSTIDLWKQLFQVRWSLITQWASYTVAVYN